MRLFSQLRSLYSPDRFRFEDFHTEIAAQVLRNSPALTLAWLKAIRATDLPALSKYTICTQETFEPLPHHSVGSRPDMTIRLFHGDRRELIIVESKQGSTQGNDQLQRYADHLCELKLNENVQGAGLVYLTRDYESTDDFGVNAEPRALNFVRTRWFIFYRWLKALTSGDGLENELLHFMRENHMALGNQFRSTHLVALENFFGVKALMDETLDGQVTGSISTIFGGFSGVNLSFRPLRERHCYAVTNANWNNIICHVGYWFPHEDPDAAVWVGVKISEGNLLPGVLDLFGQWSKANGKSWAPLSHDDDQFVASLSKGRALQTFFCDEDHVQSIREYLLELLRDVGQFKSATPTFPW